MSTKRVILANNSRLLREMIRRVIEKETDLTVVRELAGPKEVAAALERFDPDWVITSRLPDGGRVEEEWQAAHPAVRFIFLSPEHGSITMKWQRTKQQDLTCFSLKDFVQILERDLQHT